MRLSHKLVRAIVLVLAIATVVPAAGPSAVAAQSSPWDRPKPDSLSEEHVQQFLDLWSPRIRNEEFLEGYLTADEVPQPILDEGFHARTGEEKRYLIAKLYERLATEEPELALETAQAKAEGRQEFLDEQRMMLYLFVFDKQWVKDLHRKEKEKPLPDVADAMPSSPELTQAVKDMTGGGLTVKVPSAGNTLSVPDRSTVDVVAQVTERVRELAGDVPQEAPAVRDASSTPFGLGVYQLCFTGPSGYTCSADTPWGVPVDADLNGGGNDVRGTLNLPGVDPLNLNKINVSFRLDKLNPSATVGGYVAARVDLFIANKRLEVGFSAPNLAATSTWSATLNDIAQAVAGNVDITGLVTHASPGSSNAIELRVGDLNYAASITNPAESNRTLVTVPLAPVPTSLEVGFKLNRLPGVDDYRVNLKRSSTTPATIADADIRVESGAAPGALRRRITARVNPLPLNVDVHAGLLATGQINFDYQASSTTDITVDDITYNGSQIARRAGAFVDNLPATLGVVFTPPAKIVYNGSGSIPLVTGYMINYVNGVADTTYTANVKGVPSSITFDGSTMPSLISFDASAVTPEIHATMAKANGESAFGLVKNLPTSIDLAIDTALSKVTWTASSPLTEVQAGAVIKSGGRTHAVNATALSVPAQFEASYATGRPVFRGISGPIGSLSGSFTNHGTSTSFGGNYVHAYYNSANGDVDASFRMININLVDVLQTATGFTADLRMGGGQPLFVNANVLNGANKLVLQSTLNPLPTSIQLSHVNQDFTYTSDTNFTLSAYGEFGNAGGIAATPNPPAPHGVALRDGFGCVGSTCGNGFKARLFITGFPKSIVATPAAATGPKVVIGSFAPVSPYQYLTLDADLDNVVNPRVKISATQSGIPSGVNFTFGPFFTETLGDGSKKTTASYSASSGLGALSVSLERGADVGYLYISNIPSSINVTATMTNGTSKVTVNNSAPITTIQALFKRTADVSFLAGVTLTDVPSVINDLSFGRITVTSGSDTFTVPGFNYSANASTLDISAFVNASLFGGNVQAALSMLVTNLGATSRGFLQGSTLRLTSTPATSNLEIHTWGTIRYLRSFSGCLGGCGFFKLRYSGHAGVVPVTINDLAVQVTNFSDLSIALGLTSAITGSYGTFRFGWNSIVAVVDVEVDVEACVSSWCATIVDISIHATYNVNILFHLGTNHSANWWHLETGIVICDAWPPWDPTAYDVHVDLRPHPHFTQFNGFTVSSASAEGGGWLVTPNPNGILPSAAVQVAAGYTSPLGGGLSVSFPCH